MFRHQCVILREFAFVTLPNYLSTIAALGAETCSSLIINIFIIIVLSLVDLQIKKHIRDVLCC